MQRTTTSLRNRFMLGCALAAACALAAPSAFARGHYGHHGNHSGDTLAALLVGAVIGGVLVSVSNHDHDYYRGGYYYPPQPYASYGYGYPGYAPAYYGGYPGYGYTGGVNVGVVYSGGGYYGRTRNDYRRGGYRGYNHHRYYSSRRGHDGYRDVRSRHGYSNRGYRHHSGSYYQHRRH